MARSSVPSWQLILVDKPAVHRGIAQTLKQYTGSSNYKDDFDDILQKYSKYSRREFACFSFCVCLLFSSTFRLPKGILKIT